MSRETTLARAEARHAYQSWHEHKQDCPKCSRRGERCKAGAEIWELVQVTRDHLAQNVRADKLPAPGQETLF